MQLTIVAATGGVGRHLLHQALDAGHDVTAVVRSPEKLTADVPAVAIDLADPDRDALRSAVAGADAVLSGVGPRSKAEQGIVSKGTRAIVEAMNATEARRLVVVSGAGVSTVPTSSRPHPPRREPGAGFINHYFSTPLARLVLGDHFVDVATMEEVVRESGLDWTAVRPPFLTDKPRTGLYRVAFGRNVRRGFRLARADVADFMLRVLHRPETVGEAIAIAY